MAPVADETPTAMTPWSVAGAVEGDSTLLLHLGQRMVKGPDGTFVSSTCNREEHF